ncbi:MAG: helix-turn-helix domain-containing protein, partial [Nitrospinae bacterium]|nr:helix-turn-helix domain-containing protein [Nitrospinota bacterium]
MAETIGSLLEKTRIAKGLTPEQVTAKTRISANFIRAVEADRFDDLPGEVVIRGFLKTYATLLGLDPVDLLTRYDAMGITTVDKSPELISIPLQESPLGPKVTLYGGVSLALIVTVAVYWFFGSPPPPPPPVAVTTPAPTMAPVEESPLDQETTPEEAPP